MDWKVFWLVLAVGFALVFAQGVASYFDGYATQAQMRSRGYHGTSFMEHGGMWADVFIISPLVAYAMSKYQFEYTSTRAIIALFASLGLTFAALEVYRRVGIKLPEAHTHDGYTPIQGWIHALFAWAVIWFGIQIYLGWTAPVISRADLIGFAMLLTPFFYLGVAKFNEHWVFDTGARWQVAVGTIGIWVVTFIRFKYA